MSQERGEVPREDTKFPFLCSCFPHSKNAFGFECGTQESGKGLGVRPSARVFSNFLCFEGAAVGRIANYWRPIANWRRIAGSVAGKQLNQGNDMKNMKHRLSSMSIGLIAVACTPLALAQLGLGAGGAAQGALNAPIAPPPPPAVTPPAVPEPPSAPPTDRPTPAPGPSVSAGASGGLNAGAGINQSGRADAGMNANASANASTTGQSRGLDVAEIASGGVSAEMDRKEFVSQIRETAQATRGEVLEQVQARLEANTERAEALQQVASRLDARARARFDAAMETASARHDALQESLEEARDANAEEWAEARSELATDFNAYAEAMEQAEAISGPAMASAGGSGSAGARGSAGR